jgi:hypothetical protein
MIVPPGSSHPFGISMIRDDVAIVCELFMADGTLPILLDNLPVQKFSHFGRWSEFPISPRVMRIVDALDTEPDEPRLGDLFSTTAGDGFVDRTEFIATEPHGIPPDRDLERSAAGGRNGGSEISRLKTGCYNPCPRGDHDEPG